MIEGRPRESLVLYQSPQEVSRFMPANVSHQVNEVKNPNDPFKKSFGCKFAKTTDA